MTTDTDTPLDDVCAAAVDLARDALLAEVGAEPVGDYLGVEPTTELMVSHRFATTEKGYQGWAWDVSVVRAPDSNDVTVAEIVLLPGESALLPPPWVPWSERLRPGDLGVGDLLPTSADDDRLVPGYVDLDDDEADDIADLHWELGLGRPRVLSALGRDDATDRWYEGDGGPGAPIAKAAPATCSTCGFWLTLSGSLGRVFGACSNEYAPDDRSVVSGDHGCGAHSEAIVIAPAEPVLTAVTVIDDDEIEPLSVSHEPGSVEGDAAEPLGHS
ncbi:MAG: hypothetical protein QOK42_227 [Frankiaceae bacterium]|nr:hypothetical protein [Frankiaceae bacterium]